MKQIYLSILATSLWFLPTQLQAMHSPMPHWPHLASNAALYKKAAQSIDYKKVSQAINIFTPHIGVLLGNPEEDRIIYRKVISSVAQHQRFLHPQFKNNPELAAIMRQKPTVASKNPWFDIYDYYTQAFFPKNYERYLNEINGFKDAPEALTGAYKILLKQLEVPFRKPLKLYSKEQSKSTTMGLQGGFTAFDQISILDWTLSPIHTAATLYHEIDHLKHHDHAKVLLLVELLTKPHAVQISLQEPSEYYTYMRKHIESRAEYNTYHSYITCYRCLQMIAHTKKEACTHEPDAYAERTKKGYATHEALVLIAQEREAQNKLCKHHYKEQTAYKN